MAVRDFRDSQGVQWRAWDVVPDRMDPRTRDEDYLALLYITGWIVFETPGGKDKRRLYPIPPGWDELPDAELEILLRKAEVVPQRKLASERETSAGHPPDAVQRSEHLSEQLIDHPERAAEIIRDKTPDVTDLPVVRTFRYPGGRLWTVSVNEYPEPGERPALRFSAGARWIDIPRWPKDWVDLPDDALVRLLREGSPRRTRGEPPPGVEGRRWDDRPQA